VRRPGKVTSHRAGSLSYEELV